MEEFDFGGWATRNNVRCSDGRTILKDAFKHNDGQTVPLVWNHQHGDMTNILGHALLENREEGVYAHCKFNDTVPGQHAKQAVLHGDIVSLSIFANQLKQQGKDVLHGAIREVSLVLVGANPGAFIDSVMKHSDDGVYKSEDEAVIYNDESIVLAHAEAEKKEEEKPSEEKKEETPAEAEEKTNRSITDVYNEMTDEQKLVVVSLVAQAIEEQTKENTDETEGGNEMKQNAFDQGSTTNNETVLSHAQVEGIFAAAKRGGKLSEAVSDAEVGEITYLAHADTPTYGISNIGELFPSEKNYTRTPIFMGRDTGWVSKVMSSVHHGPFAKFRSLFADISADEARARGYFKKGTLKKEEVFTLLKRSTAPTTVYKKQKLDRDDIIDITDFEVVSWIKTEMRAKLDEELARAFLIGDGRLPDADDKIKEDCIRPIWTDDDKLFTINTVVEHDGSDDDRAAKFIRAAIKAFAQYEGSGNATLYTTEEFLTDMLLLTDKDGRDLYDSVAKLATKLRVKEIVAVPVMKNQTRTVGGSKRGLMGIIVNLDDYNVGADKGGAINMFEDFDIDYNQEKYLIETRCSGALVKPFSAIVLEEAVAQG